MVIFIGHNDNENANLLTSQLLIENCEINDVGNGYGKFHKIEIHNSEIKNIKSYFFTGFCNGDFIVSNSQLTNITTLTVGFGEQNFILENSTINNERYRSSNPLFLGMVSLKIINSQILDYEGLLIYSDRNRSVSLQNSVFKNINNGSNSVISLNGSVFNDCAIENCTFENCSGYFQGNFNSLKVKNSTFKNNTDFYFTGNSQKEVTIEGCTFENMKISSENYMNNGIFKIEGDANFTLNKSIIINSDLGLGLYLPKLKGTIQIQNSEFVNNKFWVLFSAGVSKSLLMDNTIFSSNKGSIFLNATVTDF